MTADPVPRLRHVGLYTGDLDAMLAFYTNVMGLTETDRGEYGDPARRIVFLSGDPGEHHEFVLADPPAGDAETVHVQQMSFLLDSLDELRELHARVVGAGIGIDRMITHGNAWSIYFRDPGGNRVEIYVRTPWYVPQPHGHPFDLSLPNEEIMAMTEAHCREDPGFMPAAEWEAGMARKMRGEG